MTISTKQEELGTVIIELYSNIVPRTVKNFIELSLSDKGYIGSKFHRIIPGFMIQGGDITKGDGTGGYSIYGETFEDENFTLKHDKPYLLSMANSGPNTNGSQFFITVDNQPHLDGKHVVFGKVIKGEEIIKDIENFGTCEGRPTADIRIIKCGLLR